MTATARGGGVGLWTLTRMCSITQTDATSHNRAKRDCGLYNLFSLLYCSPRLCIWVQAMIFMPAKSNTVDAINGFVCWTRSTALHLYIRASSVEWISAGLYSCTDCRTIIVRVHFIKHSFGNIESCGVQAKRISACRQNIASKVYHFIPAKRGHYIRTSALTLACIANNNIIITAANYIYLWYINLVIITKCSTVIYNVGMLPTIPY